MAQSWLIDPKTKDYVLDDKGKPVQTNSLTVPSYIRLKTRRGQWLYAPNTNYGSTFFQLKKHQTVGDNTLLENAAKTALTPIVNDGRASLIEINTTGVSRNSAELQTKITEKSGRVETLSLKPLGV